MSITIDKYDVGVLWCQNFASLTTFPRCIRDNRNEKSKIVSPHGFDGILEVCSKFFGRFTFRQGVMDVDCMGLRHDMV